MPSKQKKKHPIKHDLLNISSYMKSINDIEKIALQIAKEDLGSSFDIEKSIGYLSWLKKNKV
jgi:hypothetical protein